mmetsp:Transcript_36907/g.98907  ORF Transcript_36907/g.98907 Transcript_36907/m.98907 type:complete len:238 (+) Transcript_36907:665-1378(+)
MSIVTKNCAAEPGLVSTLQPWGSPRCCSSQCARCAPRSDSIGSSTRAAATPWVAQHAPSAPKASSGSAGQLEEVAPPLPVDGATVDPALPPRGGSSPLARRSRWRLRSSISASSASNAPSSSASEFPEDPPPSERGEDESSARLRGVVSPSPSGSRRRRGAEASLDAVRRPLLGFSPPGASPPAPGLHEEGDAAPRGEATELQERDDGPVRGGSAKEPEPAEPAGAAAPPDAPPRPG